jgi:hypothetical protein
VVCWLEFLRQLNLVSMQMQIFRENSLHGILGMSSCGEAMFLGSQQHFHSLRQCCRETDRYDDARVIYCP